MSDLIREERRCQRRQHVQRRGISSGRASALSVLDSAFFVRKNGVSGMPMFASPASHAGLVEGAPYLAHTRT